MTDREIGKLAKKYADHWDDGYEVPLERLYGRAVHLGWITKKIYDRAEWYWGTKNFNKATVTW